MEPGILDHNRFLILEILTLKSPLESGKHNHYPANLKGLTALCEETLGYRKNFTHLDSLLSQAINLTCLLFPILITDSFSLLTLPPSLPPSFFKFCFPSSLFFNGLKKTSEGGDHGQVLWKQLPLILNYIKKLIQLSIPKEDSSVLGKKKESGVKVRKI